MTSSSTALVQLQAILSSTLQVPAQAVELLSSELGDLDMAELDDVSLADRLDSKRLSAYRQSLEQLSTLTESLTAVSEHMEKVSTISNSINQRLLSVKVGAGRILMESDRLLAEKAKAQQRLAIVQQFTDKYSLFNSSDRAVLLMADHSGTGNSAGMTLSPEFFDALMRLTKAQEDCLDLLDSMKHQHQQLLADNAMPVTASQLTGIQEISFENAQLLDTAFNRLFQFTQQQCALVFSRDSPDISLALRRGVQCLRSKPDMFQSLVDSMTLIRRAVVNRCFLTALDHGASSASGGIGDGSNDLVGLQRPIELHSHDPVRFIGDMLAWIHQAACTEREMLEHLFLFEGDSVMEQGYNVRRRSSETSNQLAAKKNRTTIQILVTTLLDKVFEGVCRPLRIRVEQVFANQDSISESYRVANTVQFYTTMLERVILNKFDNASSQSLHRIDEDFAASQSVTTRPQLVVYLDDLSQNAFKVFYDILNTQATDFLRTAEDPPKDLSPPAEVLESLADLKTLMVSYDSSLMLPLSPAIDSSPLLQKRNSLIATAFQPSKNRENGFDIILNMFVDPLLQMCLNSAERLADPFRKSVFIVNCIHALIASLNLYVTFTRKRCDLLAAQMEVHREIIVDEQLKYMLQKSGIDRLLAKIVEINEIDDPRERTPLARILGFEGGDVHDILAGPFDSFICSINLELSTNLAPIVSPKYANLISKRCILKFIKTYRTIVDAILDPSNGYEFPMTNVLVRTIEDVETVMGLSQENLSLASKQQPRQ